MIIYFSDRKFNILGHASTNLPEGLTIVDDLKVDEVETGVSTFECVISFDEKTRSKVEEYTETGNFLLRSNEDENEYYTIIERELDTKKQEVRIYAEDAGLDLLNEIAPAYEASELKAIDHYINKFAYDSGFEIGVNEVEDLLRKLSWTDEDNVTARLASVAEQFDGCEISFSFETRGLKVTKKLINVYKSRGSNTGVRLRLNRDVDGIVKTENIENLATALKCEGAIPSGKEKAITLSGYDYDDGDFYTAYNVLYSREALEKWTRYYGDDETLTGQRGHITKTFSYDTTSQETLCKKAIAELKKRREPELNFEVEIKTLPANVHVGDRVSIVDEKGEIFLSTRLLVLESSVTQQSYKATLGEHKIKGSGISKQVEALAAMFALEAGARAEAIAAQLEAKNAMAEVQMAMGYAENAKQDAGNALAAANNAQSKIDAAEQDIQDAKNAAQEAENAAAEAERQAAQAVADAAAANAEVTVAKQKAETAITNAGAASTTANEAKEQASTASTTAAAAKLDAEQAKKDVASLGDSLETLSHTMSTDYARKTDLTETTASLQTQITQNAAKIETTAKAVTTIDETANDAKTQAAEAQNKATAAQTQASQAATDAQAAQTAATAAQSAATNAQSKATAAETAASTAKTKAEQAEEELADAKANLEAVTSRVGSTEADIAAAQQAVTAAQGAADKAKADAKTAQDAADKAKADAQTAQTTANNANTAAANAQTAANNAKAAADKAQEDADALKTRVTQAETKITQHSEAIELRATKKELEDYATTSEMQAALTVQSTAIKSEVSATYLDKTSAGNTYATKTLVTQTANDLSVNITAAGKTASNFMSYDATNGLLIGNKSSGSWSGYRAQVLPSAFNILDSSGKALASYGANLIELGKGNRNATVQLCDGIASMYNDNSIGIDWNRLIIESRDSIMLSSNGYITHRTSYDNGNNLSASAELELTSHTPWANDVVSGFAQLSATTRTKTSSGGWSDRTAVVVLNAVHAKLQAIHPDVQVSVTASGEDNAVYLDAQTVRAVYDLQVGGYSTFTSEAAFNSNVAVKGNLTVKNNGVILASKGNTSYYGMLTPEGSASGWIRTTESGLIPSAHGVSSIGSSSWQFKNGYFQNLYKGGVEVSTTDHTHGWATVSPTAGDSFVSLTGYYIAYNTSIHMAIMRLALTITPTAEITSGTAITLATLSGTIVPAATWALPIYAASSNARRWMGSLDSSGNIIVRTNSALAAGTGYTIYVSGVWYY